MNINYDSMLYRYESQHTAEGKKQDRQKQSYTVSLIYFHSKTSENNPRCYKSGKLLPSGRKKWVVIRNGV